MSHINYTKKIIIKVIYVLIMIDTSVKFLRKTIMGMKRIKKFPEFVNLVHFL